MKGTPVFVSVERSAGLYAGDERREWLVVRKEGEWRLSGPCEIWESQREANGRVDFLNKCLEEGDSVHFHNGVFHSAPGRWQITPEGRSFLARSAAILRGRALIAAKVASGEWVEAGTARAVQAAAAVAQVDARYGPDGTATDPDGTFRYIRADGSETAIHPLDDIGDRIASLEAQHKLLVERVWDIELNHKTV